MFLDIYDNNGTRYIRISESVRVEKDGKNVSRKRTIKNIGSLSNFSDGSPDFEQRLKDSFKAGNPLIPELMEFVPKNQPVKKYTFQLSELSDECIGHPKLFSQVLIERIMEKLELIQLIGSYKGLSRITFDLAGYIRLLVYGRILNPASKIATASQNSDYYDSVIKDNYPYHIYDALDFIYEHRKQIFNRLNSVITRDFKRKSDIIYYDVTNFYFEIDDPDDDILNDKDEIIEKGLRKPGVSKEERKLPIVQMGLFMDDSGIPVSYEIFPGNILDHQTVRDSLKHNVDNLDFDRFIFVGDRGMCTYKNLLHILSCGNGYLVSKSIAKSKEEEKSWIYDDSDYIVESENFKYKSRIITRREKDENGQPIKITEKVVVYWDRYFYDRQVKENRSFLEFLDKLLDSPNSFRVSVSQSKLIKRFLKKEFVNTESGEILQSSKLRTMIDKSKVDEYKRNFGYYQIVTSEIHKSEKEIIDIYHGLSRIEDLFRVMKGDLSARPVFVKTREHIDAHLAVCTIALIIVRIMQRQISNLDLFSNKDDKSTWSFGMSADRIRTALNKWTVEEIADGYFRFNDIDDPDLKLILQAFKIDIPSKLFRKSELKSLKNSIDFSN